MLRIKRVYDKPAKEDGGRVLVDRLWPRGMKKEAAKINLWMKEVAPSDATRCARLFVTTWKNGRSFKRNTALS